MFFFFQAEDGIRDLVRSRGLGDVYKRQTHGAEILIDVKMAETDDYFISLFTSTSYFKGYYTEGLIRNGSDNLDLTNKTLEGLPEWISRNGLQMAYKKFSSVILYSYVAQSFSDPLNTVSPDPSGARGIIPVSYTHLRAHETVLDLVCRLLLEKKTSHISFHSLITLYSIQPEYQQCTSTK